MASKKPDFKKANILANEILVASSTLVAFPVNIKSIVKGWSDIKILSFKWAPNYLVWAYPSGRHIVAPRSQYNQKYPDSKIRGGFIPFYPGGKKK